MNTAFYSDQQKRLPRFGLLTLGISLLAYIFCKANIAESSACYVGGILLVTAGIQIMVGMRSQQQGQSYAAATLLPFGMFWLSIIGYEIFPRVGLGQTPDAITMCSYLSLWAMFVAILFLRSFRQRLAMQNLYGTMMVCLMSLSLDQMRGDQIFLAIGCVFGLYAAFVAIYMALVGSYR